MFGLGRTREEYREKLGWDFYWKLFSISLKSQAKSLSLGPSRVKELMISKEEERSVCWLWEVHLLLLLPNKAISACSIQYYCLLPIFKPCAAINTTLPPLASLILMLPCCGFSCTCTWACSWTERQSKPGQTNDSWLLRDVTICKFYSKREKRISFAFFSLNLAFHLPPSTFS